jgi:hypothetical protein
VGRGELGACVLWEVGMGRGLRERDGKLAAQDFLSFPLLRSGPPFHNPSIIFSILFFSSLLLLVHYLVQGLVFICAHSDGVYNFQLLTSYFLLSYLSGTARENLHGVLV